MATTAAKIARLQSRYPSAVDSFESDLISLVAPDSDSTDHVVFNSPTGGKTIRLNVRTQSDGASSSFIGFQAKPGRGVASTADLIGGEISPRINSTFAVTGSVIGLHVDTYLKGTTGNITGDVRGLQIEAVDDGSSSRTVSGHATHLRIRSNISYAVTGVYSVIRVENEEGTKAQDCLVQFTTGSGCLVEANGTVGGTQAKALKVVIDATTYYIPLHTSVS